MHFSNSSPEGEAGEEDRYRNGHTYLAVCCVSRLYLSRGSLITIPGYVTNLRPRRIGFMGFHQAGLVADHYCIDLLQGGLGSRYQGLRKDVHVICLI